MSAMRGYDTVLTFIEPEGKAFDIRPVTKERWLVINDVKGTEQLNPYEVITFPGVPELGKLDPRDPYFFTSSKHAERRARKWVIVVKYRLIECEEMRSTYFIGKY